LEGETIGAALSATGVVPFCRTPSGTPRGLYYGIEACPDCVSWWTAASGQHGWMTRALDAMHVSGALPSAPAP
jgi:D-hydroxyproline dehydrogenase subunit alpha